jgi:hypothetical protein
MRLKPHAGIRSLLKQTNDHTYESALADFAYQREVLTSINYQLPFSPYTAAPNSYILVIPEIFLIAPLPRKAHGIAMGPQLDDHIMAVALESLAAGEAVSDMEGTRDIEAVPYKYGMHLPNWMNGNTDGLRREVEATLPISLTFLDNVKAEGLSVTLNVLDAKGVKPYLVYRPYYRTDEGINGALVEGYANGAVIRIRDEYFQIPLAQQAYEEGRFIVKLFNETNIGGEGFARGRAGFAEALRYWKQARLVVKGHYPKAKIISLCNTPGNDDVWFTGDQQNAPYWYHGAEAAKANPTPSEIRAAIQSCPFREMFELCDIIGIHVYAPTTRSVSGDLQTWYSRRHEQALQFLTPYTAVGKKMIINEWDMGYDDGQEARATAVVYALEHIIGPNKHVLFINHWWNGDDNEGANTWEKHQTRKGGQFRPVVHAVAAFRASASSTVPVSDPVEPHDTEEPTDMGNTEPSVDPTVLQPLPFAPSSDIRLPEWCKVERASVSAGQPYWHLKRAYWQDSDQSGGTHHIYALNPHDPTVTLVVRWDSHADRVPLEKPENEPAGNYPMFGALYSAGLEGRGTAISDSVSGMKLPQNQHVSYFLEWELRDG